MQLVAAFQAWTWDRARPLADHLVARGNLGGDLPEDWSRYHAMSLLGGVLLGQGCFALAEPLIEGGYEGMKTREARIPMPNRPVVREAAERIVRLYEGWSKPDRAAEWKSKLVLVDLPGDAFSSP